MRSEDDESKQERKSVKLALQENVDVEDRGECREAESKGIHDEEESLQDLTNHDVEIDIMEGNDISPEPLQKEINSLQTRIEHLLNEIANLKVGITKAQIFSNT